MRLVKYLFQSVIGLIILSAIFIGVEGDLGVVFAKNFGKFNPSQIFSLYFFVIYTAICFFLFPAIITKFIFKKTLKDIGWRPTKNKMTPFILIIFSLLILIPWIIQFAKMPEFQGYSLGDISHLKFFFISMTFFPFYYFCEEFFFRGFLFISLWERVRWHSFWITDIIFTLSHIGKPILEILLCIPVSIILNILTLSTRSIYPAIIVHSILGILLSFFTTYQIFAG